MRELTIGRTTLTVKDYRCAREDGIYTAKQKCTLWLYIHLTDGCDARCPFCVNPSLGSSTVDLEKLRQTMLRLKGFVHGVSLTGGEPMLYPGLVEQVVAMADEIFGEDVIFGMSSNGTNLARLPGLEKLHLFERITISRHMLDDGENQALMGFPSPTWEEIRSVQQQMPFQQQLVLSCVLQKDGVHTTRDVRDYLERAAGIGIRRVCFVGLIPTNGYCREQYVSPAGLDLREEDGFYTFTRLSDYDYCTCSTGFYESAHGRILYYYRCPGLKENDYCRQLVYTTDDRLLDGFGGNEILL